MKANTFKCQLLQNLKHQNQSLSAFRCKMSKFWRAKHDDYRQQKYTVDLKVAITVKLQWSYQNSNNNNNKMVICEVNNVLTNLMSGKHFTIYMDSNSSHCAS